MMSLKTSIFVYWMALLSSTCAYADLGGDLTSLQKDSKVLAAPRTVTTHPQYDLHEMKTGGARVHEFMDSSGKVFGIAWAGKKHPNLRTLMGAHYSEFQKAFAQARHQRRHGGSVIVEVGNLHVEMGGHMMAISGQVWLKDQIPTGMDLHEIQ
jgi:hypothetical protein